MKATGLAVACADEAAANGAAFVITKVGRLALGGRCPSTAPDVGTVFPAVGRRWAGRQGRHGGMQCHPEEAFQHGSDAAHR